MESQAVFQAVLLNWVPVDIFIVVVIVVVVIIVVVIVVVGVDDLRDEVRGEEDGGDHAEHSGRRLGGGRRAGKVFTPTLASKDVRLIKPNPFLRANGTFCERVLL